MPNASIEDIEAAANAIRQVRGQADGVAQTRASLYKRRQYLREDIKQAKKYLTDEQIASIIGDTLSTELYDG